jgi:hypothetical protein
MDIGNLLTQNKCMFSAIIVLSRDFMTHFDFYLVNRYRTHVKHTEYDKSILEFGK